MKLVLIFISVLLSLGLKSFFWDSSRHLYNIHSILLFFPTVLAIARGYGSQTKQIVTHIGQVITLTTASSLAFSVICLTALNYIAAEYTPLLILYSPMLSFVFISLGYTAGQAVARLAPTNWSVYFDISLEHYLLIKDAFFLLATGLLSSIVYIYGCNDIDSGTQFVLSILCLTYLVPFTLVWGLLISPQWLLKRLFIIFCLSSSFIYCYGVWAMSLKIHRHAVESGSAEMVAATYFLPGITISTLVASSLESPSHSNKLAFAMMLQYYFCDDYDKKLIVRRVLDIISCQNDISKSTPLVSFLIKYGIETNGELIRLIIRNNLISEEVLTLTSRSLNDKEDCIAVIEMSYSPDPSIVINSVKFIESLLNDPAVKHVRPLEHKLLERRLIGIQNNSEYQPDY